MRLNLGSATRIQKVPGLPQEDGSAFNLRIEPDCLNRGYHDQFGLTFFLALLAACGTTVLRHSAQLYPALVWIDWLIISISLTWLSWQDNRWNRGGSGQTEGLGRLRHFYMDSRTSAAILAFSLFPVVEQIAQRFWGLGDPWEVVFLSCLQVASLATALVARSRLTASLSVLLSSFQLLFVSFAFPIPLVLCLLALYTLIILWWLMGNYWSRLQTQIASRTISKIPPRARILLPATVAIALMALIAYLVAPEDALVAIRGFMPTTGGDRWGDLYAREGVGNGEQLTGAVDSADAVGPVDTNVYLSSQQPSLYDMITKAYGKPSNSNERRIDVSEDELTPHAHEKLVDRAASRNFSTRRQPRKRDGVAQARDSVALLFVTGETPLHLRMDSYDHFDGTDWQQTIDQPSPELTVTNQNQKPWIGMANPVQAEFFAGLRQHRLQFVNLNSPRIPQPAALRTWHIPLLNQTNFFSWTPDQGLILTGRERVPALTVVQLQSHRINQFELLRIPFSTSPSLASTYTEKSDQHLPDSFRLRISEWVAGASGPAELAMAVEAGMRSEFLLDDDVADESQNSVADFLAARHGPDYLFATTAALSLRELGVPSRLVTGFYGDERNHDRKTGQSIIWEHDVHTWVEFSPDGTNWLPLEPTPNYRLPPRELNWAQWATLAAWQCGRWIIRHWIFLLLMSVLLLGVYWQRCRALDFATTLAWIPLQCLPVNWQVKSCAWLLDLRLWLGGRVRPTSQTYRQWLQPLINGLGDETRGAVERFCAWLDRIRYDEQYRPGSLQNSPIRGSCNLLVRRCRSRYFASLENDTSVGQNSTKDV